MENNEYYKRVYIGHLIREEAQDREVALLPALRLAKITSLPELQSLLDLVNWYKRKLNMYISCSKVSRFPNFTFNLKERSQFTRKYFTEEFDKTVLSYDLFLDFDDKDINNSLRDVKLLKSYLDEYKVPYYIIFSGNKGFHVVIEGINIQSIVGGMVSPHKEIAENIKTVLNLKTLDLSNNSITNRLRKLPYSLVLPKDFDDHPDLCMESLMRVALPLDDKQIENFDITDCILINVLKNVKMIRRGNLERFSDLSQEQKKENIEEFIKILQFKKK